VTSIVDQYRITREGAGWTDRSGRGFLRVDGRDGIPFLQALVTNDVARLTRGDGIYAAYLTAQGRMIADLEIHHRGEALIAAVAAAVADSLATRLDASIFTEDVRVSDVTATLADLLVVGAAAPGLVGQAFGLDRDAVAALPELGQIDVADGFVARSGEAPVDAFRVVVSANARERVASRLEAAGAHRMSGELVDAMRVAAGRPAFGIDMTDQTIPLEAGLLERAISTTKGCYVGQEIVIRILHRGSGRVARRLVTLRWTPPDGDRPEAGTALVRESRTVGLLTSVAPALTGEGLIGLGYVARDLAVVGQRIGIGEAAAAEATITGLAG
jgi:folate-binding protein YgfZ